MIPLPKIEINQDVFFLLLTASFLLIALLKARYWKHTKLLLYGVFAQRYANQFLREENVFTERVNIITFFLITINFSVVIAQIYSLTSFIQISSLLMLVGGGYLLKVIIIRVFGEVFMSKGLAKLTVFFSFLFDRAFAIYIYPLSVGLLFFHFDVDVFLLIISAVLFAIITTLKFFWIWRIGAKGFGVPSFYIFLYLCTLEILPIILVSKLA